MNRVSIVACARWETNYLEEWVRYHLFIGIDHIYLYCNDDCPNELYETIASYCCKPNPQVTFIHYPFVGEQWKMYMDFLSKYRFESQSICFLDVDEFITIKGTDDINQWIEVNFKSDWECIFLNWLHYGNNNHYDTVKGKVLKNYTRRQRILDHFSKVIVKTRSIDIDFMSSFSTAFWHGIASNGYNVFNFDLIQYDSAGRNYPWFYEKWWSIYNNGFNKENMEALTIPLLEKGYISHFFIKSVSDIHRRIKRGTKGNFTNQNKWSELDTEDKINKFLLKYNEVEDFYLSDTWNRLHKLKSNQYFIPPVIGENIALYKPCDQSSISIWSSKENTKDDASEAVNGVINGVSKNHTELEESPWWYIDLQKRFFIKEIRIFHRKEKNQQLFQLAIDLSDDKLNWNQVYIKTSNKPIGGIDGNPLIISINENTRYVRIRRLYPGYLHFDQIQIFS